MVAAGQEVFDVSRKGSIYFLTKDGIPSLETYTSSNERQQFAEGTRGVLYFRHNPQNEKASEIRFRLCEDVSQFDAGSDLLRPNGEPWNVPLRTLRRGGRIHQGIISLLQAEYKMENIFGDDWVLGDRGNRYVQRSVLTLCPEKIVLLKQEVFDISRLETVFLRIRANDSSAASTKTSEALYVDRVLYQLENNKAIPFPPNTKGIFYYEKPPAHRAPFGQLRFRNCSDAVSFDRGTDLCLPSGEPWRLDLWNIVSGATLGIKHLLIKEGLVDSHVLGDLRNRPIRRSIVLFSLNQPFVFDVSQRQHTFQLVVTGSKICRFVMHRMARVEDRLTPFYFHGRVMARFELSTLPEHAKYGLTLVLRILEILTPIEPVKPLRPGLAFPKPGSLLSIEDRKVWKFRIDKRRAHGQDRDILTAFVEKSRTQGKT